MAKKNDEKLQWAKKKKMATRVTQTAKEREELDDREREEENFTGTQ